MSHGDPCACRQVAESSRRVCPNCEHVEVTAIPFQRSAAEYGVCREHDKPVPTLTALSGRHFEDERGYTCCAACGFVLEDFRGELAKSFSPPRYDPNYYAQLAQKHGGFVPWKRGKSGKRFDALALNSADGSDNFQRKIARTAEALRDAEVLCDMLDVRGDTKAAVMHAVEAFRMQAHPGTRRMRLEAVLIALVEQVAERHRGKVESTKALRAFNVTNDQITIARKSVGRWFDTYWIGDKR